MCNGVIFIMHIEVYGASWSCIMPMCVMVILSIEDIPNARSKIRDGVSMAKFPASTW